MIKDIGDVGPHMPFAGHIRLISGFMKKLGPEFAFPSPLIQPGFCSMGIPYRQSRIQTGPAGHTNRTVPGPHDVRIGEDRPFLKKSIDMRGLHLLISQRMDGPPRQIVHKKKEDIGTFGD